MQKILDSINNKAQESILLSSKAIKTTRGKILFSLDYQDIINTYEITIACLEEEFSGVEKKLEELEKAINLI
jgi:hypothetical protein